jgi:alpha-mannosidase
MDHLPNRSLAALEVFDDDQARRMSQGFQEIRLDLEDKPSAWDAWNIGLTGTKFPSTFRHAEIVETGPVRVVLRLYRDYLKPGTKKDFPTEDFPSSFFTQDIILYDGLDRVDFRTDVDWWEEKTMLKVAFPLTVQDTVATYEIPYGTIQRSTQMRNSWEKAKVEVPALRWADVSSGGYGVSLLNNSKYGHEFNTPLVAVTTQRQKGPLPHSSSFVSLEPSSLILSAIKKAEDSNTLIMQWYDATGDGATARLKLNQNPKKVVMSNFMEEDGDLIPFTGNTILVPTKRNGIVTLKVHF